MADIKTHLRELSVATTIGLLSSGIRFSRSDLYDSNKFFQFASRTISNDISSASNILDYSVFSGELRLIVDNGYKLGVAIYEHPHFHISGNTDILWLGNDTKKDDPIDIVVGEDGFSLKEDSFILKNMGLYEFLNCMTGSSYARGIHVFKTFAYNEYEAWFEYTWKSFVRYLGKNTSWNLRNGTKLYSARIFNSSIIMRYNNSILNVPINIQNTAEFMRYTTADIREKVFSKWINNVFSNDIEYKRLKKHCSEIAGWKVCKLINTNYNPIFVYKFLQIYKFEYYYAKTTNIETTILRIPSKHDFNLDIEFVGCEYSVPASQLNIISTFRNKTTGKEISFRNECRFSHGQFNGTPEAKMYVVRNTPLTELYEPI